MQWGFCSLRDGGEMEKINRILKLPEVIQVTGLARSTIYLRMKEKTFPTHIKLGERSVGWLEEEVHSWLDQRISESRPEGGSK
jgi:prophage regulatory protein